MNLKESYEQILAMEMIEQLKTRQMNGYYCHNKTEVQDTVSKLTANDSIISYGGSMTLNELDIIDMFKKKNEITLLDRDNCQNKEEINTLYHNALSSDTYLMSTNAITRDGQLFNIDGNGNRVAALIYGPKQVIVICGMNKVVTNLDEAMIRVRNTASPQNCIRLDKKTPCAATGNCHNCLSNDCICNQMVTTRRSGIPGRIKVILVAGSYGY